MLASVLASFNLAGAWYGPGTPSQSTVKDINGHILNIGDLVSLMGVVTDIQNITLNNGNITVQLSYPVGVNYPTITVNGISLMAEYISGS